MLADGQITDEEYESGIAALDEEQLLQEGRTESRQAKTKPPARQDTPTDGVKHSFVGYDSNTGKGIYEGNFPKGMPKKAKSERILQLIQDVWSKKPIRLVISNGEKSRTIYARFDPYIDPGENIPTDASKIAGGNRHGNHTEQRVTLDLGEDYYQIASEASYNYSKMETGKSLETHNDVIMWHYFVNDILFAEQGSTDLIPYTVTINVKEKTDGDYVYSFNAEKESSTQRTLHAAVNTYKGANGELFLNNIISDSNEIVKNEADNKNHSFSPVESAAEGVVTDGAAEDPGDRKDYAHDEAEYQAKQAGYPVLHGVQVVPYRTWVNATDHGHNNFGLVTGRAANNKLIVHFWNKHGEGPDGKDTRKKVAIGYEHLRPVDGVYQMTQEEYTALMESAPIDPNSEEFTAEQMAEIMKEYERAWQEEHSAKTTEWAPVNRAELPARATPFLTAAERKLKNFIAKALSVPPVRNRDYLNGMVQEISDEILQTGQVTDETLTLYNLRPTPSTASTSTMPATA